MRMCSQSQHGATGNGIPRHYYLARDIHACRIDESYVFLDAACDRYLFFRATQASWLYEIATVDVESPLSADAVCFAEHLRRQGLLRQIGKFADPIPAQEECSRPILGTISFGEAPNRVGLRELVKFAVLFLRWSHLQTPSQRSLPMLLAAVRRAKRQASMRPYPGNEIVRRLSNQYHAMTPWLFSIHDACFFSSFLLVLFLARHGISADWVFGVRLSPFGAHCWVSHRGVILNEDPDIAAAYRTILIV